MKLKNIIIVTAIAGLIVSGQFAAAATAGALYCAQWTHCTNSTSCSMTGSLANEMYLESAQLQNGTKAIQFNGAMATSIKKGQARCGYQTDGNWPSFASFFSMGTTRLYPVFSNNTKWSSPNGSDEAGCYGSSKDCPFTHETPTMRV